MPTIGNATLTDNTESITDHDKHMFMILALCGIGVLFLVAISRLCSKSGFCANPPAALVPLFNTTASANSTPPPPYSEHPDPAPRAQRITPNGGFG